MTVKQRALQKSLLRRLHTAPRYLHLYADDTVSYRAWMVKHLGVNSSKELKLDTLIELVEYMEMTRDTPPANRATAQQINYIRYLWSIHATFRDEASMLSFASRILRVDVADIEAISPKGAQQLIAGIKKLRPASNIANNPSYGGEL